MTKKGKKVLQIIPNEIFLRTKYQDVFTPFCAFKAFLDMGFEINILHEKPTSLFSENEPLSNFDIKEIKANLNTKRFIDRVLVYLKLFINNLKERWGLIHIHSARGSIRYLLPFISKYIQKRLILEIYGDNITDLLMSLLKKEKHSFSLKLLLHSYFELQKLPSSLKINSDVIYPAIDLKGIWNKEIRGLIPSQAETRKIVFLLVDPATDKEFWDNIVKEFIKEENWYFWIFIAEMDSSYSGQKSFLESLSHKHPHIKFLGARSDFPALTREYAEACIVISSNTSKESTTIPALSEIIIAGAFGVPIIAPFQIITKEYFDEHLWYYNSQDELIEATKDIFYFLRGTGSLPEKISVKCYKNRKRIEEYFSLNNYIQKLNTIYEQYT